MFEELYTNMTVKNEEKKAEEILYILYEYYMERPELLTGEFGQMLEAGENKSDVVCDYIAGMTDNYAIEVFEDIYIPRAWSIR